jgi:hypothetical protein
LEPNCHPPLRYPRIAGTQKQDKIEPSDCVEKHWQQPPGIVGARIARPCPPFCSAGASRRPSLIPNPSPQL